MRSMTVSGLRFLIFGFISWKDRFSSFVSVMYRDHEADMTDIALFFDRTDSIAGILGLQKTYLPW